LRTGRPGRTGLTGGPGGAFEFFQNAGLDLATRRDDVFFRRNCAACHGKDERNYRKDPWDPETISQ
jgi:mono/diheme cytochrome c family protein